MNLAKKQTYIEREKKQAIIETDENGIEWAACPYCTKKAIPMSEKAKVSELEYICRNNKCPAKKFIINYNSNFCMI